MRLVHDLLDAQVLDCEQRPTGKVDGILLELRPDRPPRLDSLELGGAVVARRLHPRLGALAIRWSRRLGPAALHAVRVPWKAVRRIERPRFISHRCRPHAAVDARALARATLPPLPGSGRGGSP